MKIKSYAVHNGICHIYILYYNIIILEDYPYSLQRDVSLVW